MYKQGGKEYKMASLEALPAEIIMLITSYLSDPGSDPFLFRKSQPKILRCVIAPAFPFLRARSAAI